MMCWTILHASRFGSYMSWIIFPNDILVELFAQNILHRNLHPIWHLLPCLPNMLWQPKNYGMLLSHLLKGICKSQFAINKNKIRPTHQCTFFALVASCSFANPYNDGVTFRKRLISPQSHMLVYTTSSLFNKNCNIMLSLDKSLCKIP